MKMTKAEISPFKILFAMLSIACMVMIFCFSNENSDVSSDTSGRFTKIAVELFMSDFDEMAPDRKSVIIAKTDHIIRKAAHFSIYALLGFLVSCSVGKRKPLTKGSFLSLIICFLYAYSDELHQYFVPGRSCRFTDVLIDTSGSAVGIILSLFLMNTISKMKNSP